LFFVGLPSSYSLAPLEPAMPRLPSYESVRKKDRQRQIHMMIADRFGLNGPAITEVSQWNQNQNQIALVFTNKEYAFGKLVHNIEH